MKVGAYDLFFLILLITIIIYESNLIVILNNDKIIFSTKSIKKMFGYDITDLRIKNILKKEYNVIYEQFLASKKKNSTFVKDIFENFIEFKVFFRIKKISIIKIAKIYNMSNMATIDKILINYIDNNNDGIIITDNNNFNIIYANDNFIKKFNLKEEIISSIPINYIFVDSETYESTINKIKTEETHSFEIVCTKFDTQKIVCNVYVYPFIQNGELLNYVWIFNDITGLKEQERILKDKNDIIFIKNREMQEFVRTASHDLQEPLRKITNFCDLLSIGEISDVYIASIQSSAKQMQYLIDNLLKLSILTTKFKFSLENLDKIINDVLTELDIPIRDNNIFVSKQKLGYIECDKKQIHELFYNIIENSIKFRKNDVPCTISIKAEHFKDQHSLLRNNDFIRIFISDNGIGLPNDTLYDIFQPFCRLFPNIPNNYGMGLAICQRIIETHSGTIKAENAVDGGATITIELPILHGE